MRPSANDLRATGSGCVFGLAVRLKKGLHRQKPELPARTRKPSAERVFAVSNACISVVGARRVAASIGIIPMSAVEWSPLLPERAIPYRDGESL